MNTLRMGMKIGGGFGILIIIALLLGGLAIWNMLSVGNQSTQLSDAYVSEVNLANEIERNTLLAMYGFRGYGLSEEDGYLKEGQEALQSVFRFLQEAQSLADQYAQLIKLNNQLGIAKNKVDAYRGLVDETIQRTQEITTARTNLDNAAENYMSNGKAFFDDQSNKLQHEIAQGIGKAGLDQRRQKVELCTQVLNLGYDVRVANFKAQATRNPSLIEDVLPQFDTIHTLLNQLQGITFQQYNLDQIAAIRIAGNDYKDALQNLLESWDSLQKLNIRRNDVATDLLTAVQETAAAGMNQTQHIATSASESLGFATWIMIIGLVIALIVGIMIAIVITRGITVPLRKAVDFANAIATKDLTHRLDIQSKDEIGELAVSLNEMNGQLARMIQNIGDVSRHLAASAEQINASAATLSDGSQTQSASVEETSSSMEELSASIEEINSNSTELNNRSGNLQNVSESSQEVVEETIQAMNRIKGNSNQIQDIMGVISDIADQTNLLSLNASIEAARAGEYGRGFAVVAQEISQLADRSANSTKEVAVLMQETIRNVDNGVRLVNDSGDAFRSINGDVMENGNLISSIVDAIEQQTQGAQQVQSAMNDINDITQSVSSSAEELSSSTVELQNQAENLASIIGEFQIEDTEADASMTGHSNQQRVTTISD